MATSSGLNRLTTGDDVRVRGLVVTRCGHAVKCREFDVEGRVTEAAMIDDLPRCTLCLHGDGLEAAMVRADPAGAAPAIRIVGIGHGVVHGIEQL